jgi:hypothetical protein
MKKKLLHVSTLAVMVLLVTGCATPYPVGLLYTELNLPHQAVSQSEVSYTKVGVAKATSVLGLVTTGDASQRAAIRNGQITKVKYIDYSVKNILGIYGEYTVTVYGD